MMAMLAAFFALITATTTPATAPNDRLAQANPWLDRAAAELDHAAGTPG
jgi:hypothetical protein